MQVASLGDSAPAAGPPLAACRRYLLHLLTSARTFSRFKDVRACEKEMLLFSEPFSIEMTDVPENMELELIEL